MHFHSFRLWSASSTLRCKIPIIIFFLSRSLSLSLSFLLLLTFCSTWQCLHLTGATNVNLLEVKDFLSLFLPLSLSFCQKWMLNFGLHVYNIFYLAWLSFFQPTNEMEASLQCKTGMKLLLILLIFFYSYSVELVDRWALYDDNNKSIYLFGWTLSFFLWVCVADVLCTWWAVLPPPQSFLHCIATFFRSYRAEGQVPMRDWLQLFFCYCCFLPPSFLPGCVHLIGLAFSVAYLSLFLYIVNLVSNAVGFFIFLLALYDRDSHMN